MRAREVEPRIGATAPMEESAAETSPRKGVQQLREALGTIEQTARGMLEAEDALHLVRQRYEQTADPDEQGELAAEALEHVERQLELTHERRRQLDSIEAKLWGRQNRLEGFLIHTRGSAWWHTHRAETRSRLHAVTSNPQADHEHRRDPARHYDPDASPPRPLI
jgi:hypothetical protein